MSPEPDQGRRRSKAVYYVGIVVVLVGVVLAVLVLPTPGARYRFMAAVLPIDVMSDRTGRWFYYQAASGNGTAPALAATVREELLPLGFTEDTSNKPWFRFVKGGHEVVVCHHDEIMTAPGPEWSVSVHHQRHRGPRSAPSMVVLWVHEPGEDPIGTSVFKMKKAIYRW